MYVDSHTHLNEPSLFVDREKHLNNFQAAGGTHLVNIGVDPQRNQRAIAISQQAKQKFDNRLWVKATVGIHPSEVSFGNIASTHDIKRGVDKLRQLVKQYPDTVVAIGEAGIDAHYTNYEEHRELQMQLFYAQVQLAQELSLPLVIHSRDQFSDSLEITKQFPNLPIYFHCRGYGPDEVSELTQTHNKLRIGFCGNISYKKAAPIRETLRLIRHQYPHVHILLETDAPYLSPQNKRGEKNVPVNVIDIYQYVAHHFNIELSTLQKETKQSFLQLYTQTK